MAAEDIPNVLVDANKELEEAWPKNAAAASERAGQIGEKVIDLAKQAHALCMQAAALLKTTYPREVAAQHEKANDVLKSVEGKLAQTLEGATNQHAVDILAHLRDAIQEGNGITAEIRTQGPMMANLIEENLAPFIGVMEALGAAGVYFPFHKDSEHMDLLTQFPEQREGLSGSFGSVGAPLGEALNSIESYLEEL